MFSKGMTEEQREVGTALPSDSSSGPCETPCRVLKLSLPSEERIFRRNYRPDGLWVRMELQLTVYTKCPALLELFHLWVNQRRLDRFTGGSPTRVFSLEN